MGLLDRATGKLEETTPASTGSFETFQKKKSLLKRAEEFFNLAINKSENKGLLNKAEEVAFSQPQSQNQDPQILNPRSQNLESQKDDPLFLKKEKDGSDDLNDRLAIQDEKQEELKSEDVNLANVEEIHGDEKNQTEKEEKLEDLHHDDLFNEWEKEAVFEAGKVPFRPKTEDPVEEKRDYLFDDDSDFTTAPSEIHIASKKKIENYLALFELVKDISRSDSYEDFFESLTYSLIGQVGCANLAVFSSLNSEFELLNLVQSHGMEINPDWGIKKGDELFSIFSNESSVRYAADLDRKLPKREADFLKDTKSEIVSPIRDGEKFYGIILCGKNISGEDYTADDLEFIKIAGEIAGSFFEKLQNTEKKNQLISHLNEVIRTNEMIISLSRKLSEARNLDSVIDLVVDTFARDLGVSRYSLFLYEKNSDGYFVFSSNILSPEKTENLMIKKDSELVGIVGNIQGVYNIEGFRQLKELRGQLSNDELGFIKEFIAIPFINLNWLVGMFVVHETTFPWTNGNREAAVGLSEISAPVIANVIILKDKEALFRDPFNPIEKRIEKEIFESAKFKIPFCLAILKVQNAGRVVNLLGQEFYISFVEYFRNKISENLSESDLLVKIGQGKFALVFHGKDSEEAGIVIKKIKVKIDEFEKSPKEFKLQVSSHILSYPTDAKDKSRFMEFLDES